MSKHRALGYGIRLPDAFVEPIQEFISTYVSPNFQVTLANATTIQVVAGTDNDQAGLAVSGKWRYNTATTQRAHPGGGAGTYDVWVVTGDNIYVATDPETDDTDYSFTLRILAHGAGSPATGSGATFWARKVAELHWTGSAIDKITPTGYASITPLFTGYGAGIVLDFSGPEANIPPNTAVADGRYIANADYPDHFAAVGTSQNNTGGLPNPPAGNHRVIDLRGRGTVGKGDMGTGNANTPTATTPRIQRSGINTIATIMGEEYHTLLTAEMPSHSHTGTTGSESSHTHTGTTSAGSAHSHSATGLTFTGTGATTGAGSAHAHSATGLSFSGSGGTTGGFDSSHSHSASTDAKGEMAADNSDPINKGTDHADFYNASVSVGSALGVHTHSFTPAGSITGNTANESAHTHSFTPAGTMGGSTASESAHTHTFTTSAGSAHTHSISAEGGGGSHENVHPVAVVVKVVTLR